jgi:hypothetical protein
MGHEGAGMNKIAKAIESIITMLLLPFVALVAGIRGFIDGALGRKSLWMK